MNGARFANRREAGRLLASHLSAYAKRSDVLVLALPRGGVPVAHEIAHALEAPLDVFLVRKLGVPGHEELALGAIASGDVRVVNYEVVRALGIPSAVIDTIAAREQQELQRRERLYREGRPPIAVRERTVIIVDDGLATGSTMHAAVQALRKQGADRVVVAVPVAPREACDQLRAVVDDIVCTATPEHFHAVGRWYEDFRQMTDDEVRDLLGRSFRAPHPA